MAMDTHEEYRRQPALTPPEKEPLSLPVVPSTTQQSNGPQTNGRGNYHLNHVEIKLESVDRIQTQVNLNRASLESTARELKKSQDRILQLEDALRKVTVSYAERFEYLQTEFAAQLAALRQQIAATSNSALPAGERLDDQTLEIFTRNLSAVSDKANKVDSMEMDIQLIKRRVHKMEEYVTHSSSRPPRETTQNAVTHRPAAPPAAHASPVINHHVSQPTSSRQPSHYSHQTTVIDPRAHAVHPEQSASGWATVNQSSKRTHSELVANGSPKRPKLAPLEPRVSGAPRPEAEESSRYRTQSNDSYPESNGSTGYLPQAQEAHEEAYVQSQRAVSGPAYHNPTQTPPSASSRGRGRGGRPRKYMHPDTHAAVAAGWPDGKGQTVVIDGQMVRQGADGQYYAITESVYASGRRESLNGAVPIPAASHKDPYAHTKKTRTKPIRNQDGILIRKDGKPDMRSQSSAANLRKVHARKEEQRSMGASHGSTGSPAMYDDDFSRGASPMPDSASDTGHRQDSEMREHEIDGSEPRRSTEEMMKVMYPHGVEQRGRQYSPVHQSPPPPQPRGSDDMRTSEEFTSRTPDHFHRPELNGDHKQPSMPVIKAPDVDEKPVLPIIPTAKVEAV